ncbi:hypothetical protein D3C84_759850 [compost metagenome]
MHSNTLSGTIHSCTCSEYFCEFKCGAEFLVVVLDTEGGEILFCASSVPEYNTKRLRASQPSSCAVRIRPMQSLALLREAYRRIMRAKLILFAPPGHSSLRQALSKFCATIYFLPPFPSASTLALVNHFTTPANS